jgi:hypothetical protein
MMLFLCSLEQPRTDRLVEHIFLLDEDGNVVHIWWTGNTGNVTRLDTGALQIQMGVLQVGLPVLVEISANSIQLLDLIRDADEATQAHIAGAVRLSTQIKELAAY